MGSLTLIDHEYHNIRLSNSNKMAILSCYRDQIYFVDVENKSNPSLLYKYSPKIGIVCDFAFSPKDEYIIMGGT